MRTPVAVALTYIGLAIAAAFPRLAAAQVPDRSSVPRLVVPVTEAPAQPTPGQPTAAPAPDASAPTAAASPDATPPGPPAGAPPTQVTGASNGITQLGGGAGAPQTSSTSYAATDARSYTAGRFALLVDGAQVGPVKSLEGGTPVADVASGPAAGKKHLSGVKYEEITAQVGIGAKSLLDWVAETWKGNPQRRSGSIVDMDINYKSVGERQFKDALITQTTIPTLDGGSKDAGYFTVKIAPGSVTQSAGSGADLGSVGSKQKAWLASNFRFEMDGLDATKVASIESFTVGQPVAKDEVGITRDYEKQAGSLAFPNLKISISKASASSWSKWFNDFVVMGNNSDEQEKNGAIVFLAPDMKAELGRISLSNCGIFRLAPEKLEATSEKIARVTAELYCERMELLTNK